ncbi:hypothetical protein [Flavobacterium sp. LHD-85]|uniref:hypothetical protein n=1 Tax=Flavobacterium sp. LHD-85 TaxID=3071410 RepID=UPI0027DF9E5B|nr:hypothetical protein [Flavobacterium sp. LHD-85]MDQ6532147.1 hypothetical protein [Flavobacterium sp. LHD-85]
MKKWFIKFLPSLIILLSGYGNAYANSNQFANNKLHCTVFVNGNLNTENYTTKNHSFETFKRKGCLLDNEENEENFSSIQKQLAKSNYFLSFLCNNKFVVSSTDFTKKVNDCKIFTLLYNKVYLLFQVFRI